MENIKYTEKIDVLRIFSVFTIFSVYRLVPKNQCKKKYRHQIMYHFKTTNKM